MTDDLALALEAVMIAKAERLLFISDALMAYYVSRYPGIEGKCEVVRHPVATAATSAMPRGFAGLPVRATLMGNFNHSNLDAAIRMVRVLARRDDIRIRLCTPVPKLLLMARGMDLSRVEFLGYVPEEQMPGILETTDMFLLPHGLGGAYSTQEYRTIFPTRTAYYLAQGRPILAHCPKGSGLAEFLTMHGCAQCVLEPDDAALASAFEALCADAGLQLKMAGKAIEAAKLFDPLSILLSLTGGRQVEE